MWYRSKTARVLWPLISIASFSLESGFDHVRERRPAKVVIKSMGYAGGFAGTFPRLLEIEDRFAFMLNQERTRGVRAG
jgi:hypothetical protein